MATQVTVNGVPVEQLIKEQDAQEISEVRQSENRVKVYRAKRSSSWRVPRSKGVPVRNWNLPDYQNWAREPLIIVSGQVYPRILKGDFAPSGVSIIGALEYDPKKEAIKCHECGEWRRVIGATHLRRHGIRAKEYKERHGFNSQAALCAPEICRERSIRAGRQTKEHLDRFVFSAKKPKPRMASSVESLNNREHCPIQLPAKLVALANELGRTPAVREFYGRYGDSSQAVAALFGSYSGLVKQAGLLPNPIGRSAQYTREELLERIRRFSEVCRRTPSRKDFTKAQKGLLPSYDVYKRVFGSWQNAVGMCM